MRILLTGKNGQLGWELHRQLKRDYEVLAIGHEDIGFLDSKFMSSVIRQLPKFNLIVNAAAYTDIDKAEYKPFVAETVNSEAAAILAAEAEHRGIPMIHFSANHVFGNGWQKRPYRETDKPSPISMYGGSKLDGEIRIRNILEKHWIFRRSGLYGSRGKNCFTTILHRNRRGIVPHVADDQVISPNWTSLIAEAVVDAIQQLFWGEKIPWGTYHLSGSGSTTPYKFARLICEKANELWGGGMFPIPSTSKTCRTIAKRPKYSVLDPSRFNTVFQNNLPDWQEQFLRFFGGIDLRQVRQ
jgi:dTDP-4-dehydrorhamnose reductase